MSTTRALTESLRVDHLVADHRTFCQLAFERNSLNHVGQLVNAITPVEKPTEEEEDEPESISRLREVCTFFYLRSTYVTNHIPLGGPHRRCSYIAI